MSKHKPPVIIKCDRCGQEFKRLASAVREHNFCSAECSREWLSERMSAMNVERNPDRMTFETRTKLRKARLGTGAGKTYERTYGRHTHRIIAERMLGRKLRPDEVVHHIDGNKRNNAPENLMVLTRAEHAKLHADLKRR